MLFQKKKFKSLEKRIADLEGQVQSQQEEMFVELVSHRVVERLKELSK